MPLEEEVGDLIQKGVMTVTRFKGSHRKFKGPTSLDFGGTAQVMLRRNLTYGCQVFSNDPRVAVGHVGPSVPPLHG